MDRRRSDEEMKALFRETFEEEIKQLFTICQETTNAFAEAHKTEHDFIKTQIAKEYRKQKLFDEVIKQVLGWGVIAVIGGLGALIWASVLQGLYKP